MLERNGVSWNMNDIWGVPPIDYSCDRSQSTVKLPEWVESTVKLPEWVESTVKLPVWVQSTVEAAQKFGQHTGPSVEQTQTAVWQFTLNQNGLQQY